MLLNQIERRKKLIQFFIGGLWFALLAIAAERGFWWIIGVNPGYFLGQMVAVWSFVFGGAFGTSLLSQTQPTGRRIIGVGLAVPILALFASCMAFGLIGAIGNLFRGKPLDGVLQLLFSPLLALVMSGSMLIVVFWVILPVGLVGSWLLSCVGRLRVFGR